MGMFSLAGRFTSQMRSGRAGTSRCGIPAVQVAEYDCDCILEFWEVVLDGSPNTLEVDFGVIVNNDVAHPNDEFPWNLRVQRPGGGREFCGGLAHDRNLPNDTVLHQTAAEEIGLPVRRVLVNSLKR